MKGAGSEVDLNSYNNVNIIAERACNGQASRVEKIEPRVSVV